jgi:hypothetical protein
MYGSINDDRESLRGRLMGDEGKEVVPSPPPKRKRSSDSSSSAVIRGLKKPSKGGVALGLGDRGTRDDGIGADRSEMDHSFS